MGKTSTFFVRFFRILCLLIILWFLVYFFFGEQFSVVFKDRVFASYFPQILVFLTAASVYGLFILAIKSSYKKWQNILLFIGGFLFAITPFLAYHGYFQYQCGFWNDEVVSEKTIYVHKSDHSKSVKEIISNCKVDKPGKTDTVFSKQFTPYFELQNPVKIQKSENADWSVSK